MLLNARDAARLLQTSEQQLYRWVDAEEIPFQRIRDQVRFNRTELLEWATTRRLPVAFDAFENSDDPDEPAPSLAEALRIGGVHHDVPATSRDDALAAVVELTPVPESLDRELVTAMLVARETTSSSAVGEGIAIPHVRHPVVAPGAAATVSVSYLRTPLAFGARDGVPVHTVFMIVSPTVLAHLQILARLAKALLDAGFRAALARHAPLAELVVEARRLEATPARDAGGGAR
jgi:PTS system nitrogen regulatory IIA component